MANKVMEALDTFTKDRDLLLGEDWEINEVGRTIIADLHSALAKFKDYITLIRTIREEKHQLLEEKNRLSAEKEWLLAQKDRLLAKNWHLAKASRARGNLTRNRGHVQKALDNMAQIRKNSDKDNVEETKAA